MTRYYSWRWRFADSVQGLPETVRDWWSCRRGRHATKLQSHGRCYRCGKPVKAGAS